MRRHLVPTTAASGLIPVRLAACALLLLALSGASEAASDAVASGATSSSASAGAKRVPCSSLPELQALAMKVAILGDCWPTTSDSTVKLQSLDSASSASGAVPQGWIIKWKAGAAAATAGGPGQLNSAACTEGSSPALSGRFNATCTHRYAAAMPGFAARFQRAQLAHFLEAYAAQLDSVAPDSTVSMHSVSLSGGTVAATRADVVHSNTLDSASAAFRWGLDRLDQASLPLDGRYQYYNGGEGVHVYILDTGIRASHQEFAYRDGRPGSRAGEVFAAPSLDPAGANQDCEGHGTHVAAVVGGLSFGVAKDVRLHAVRILDCQGNGAVSDVLLALDWLKLNAQRPAIVSMSLGGEVQLQLDEAVRMVAQEGIHVVVAAGNEDMDACDTSPARESSAITVAASDSGDRRLWLSKGKGSNYGECVDLFAPGTDILSAAGNSDDAQQLRTGTSQAVPFVAGVMALVLQNATGMPPADLQRLIVSSASPGRLTEQPGSGFATLGASSTANLVLQSSSKAPIVISPDSFPAVEAMSAGPLTFSVALTQRPVSDVQMAVSVDATRGGVQPASLRFTPDAWSTPQTVTLTVSPHGSPSSTPLAVTIKSTSADSLFQASQTAVQVTDRKGDTLQYPKVLTALPFAEQASTGGTGSGTAAGVGSQYNDDYQVSCGAGDSDAGGSADVVYYFKPASDCTVTASLCGSAALPDTFDSRIYLLADVDGGGQLVATACSNDVCGALPALTASLKAGVGYAFVVDGVGGASGRYSISITAAQGEVQGQLPPASLVQASFSVAPMGPAPSSSGPSTGFSTEGVAGGSRYWLLGPWSDCTPDCQQSRTAACYDTNGGSLPLTQCSELSRPATQQPCDGCGVQANSSASSAPQSGNGGSSTVIIIAACSAGAAMAVAVATGGFLLFRRRQQRQQTQQGQQVSEHGKSNFGVPAESAGQWEAGADGEHDCIPLPKNLRPIVTGRSGQRTGAPSAGGGGTQHLAAAAGTVAAQLQHQQQQRQGQQQGQGEGAYASAVAHLHSLAPDYHVVTMPSPRLPGQDTGSPSGLRRSLRQRSPTRRPRESARATPEAAAGEHRLSRSASGHPTHDI